MRRPLMVPAPALALPRTRGPKLQSGGGSNASDLTMRRLFFLLPDRDLTSEVVSELEAAGVPHGHLHVIASITQDLEELPEATVWQKTEMARGIELGIGLGGTAGLLGGVLAVAFPPAGLVLGGGAVVATALAGAGIGGVVSALMSSHAHNADLDTYQEAIARGEILLLVDIPKKQVDAITSLVMTHHPEAKIGVARPR